ncbi:MAG: DUF4349 domain-containing protein [Bacteroidia bacterium]|nr:DUF4349 domain-containing protein [Bacteroidia bacterium]
MKTHQLKPFILITFLGLVACNGGSSESANSYDAGYATEENFAPKDVEMDAKSVADNTTSLSENQNNLKTTKKIIKDGSMSIKTGNLNKSKQAIDQLLKRFNAYYENESLEKDYNQIAYNLRIRVAADSFDKFIAAIETGEGDIRGKNIQVRDVTGQYIDLSTRLESKKEYLNRYKELLSKANSVKDILEIENSISNLQAEIESIEAQFKVLNQQISESTLDLYIVETLDYVYKSDNKINFFERLKQALENGWQALVEFTLFLISVWPFLIIIPVAIHYFKKYKKWKRAKKEAK